MTDTRSGSWADGDQVESYLSRMEGSGPRHAGEHALLEVLPDQPRRMLDLGCGDGRLAALVLDARPEIEEAVCTDISPPMLRAARERFAREPRATILERNMESAIVGLGHFDLVVSAFAIHHLEDERKQTLFGEVASQLEPGGVFANLEVIASATARRHDEFLRAIGRTENDPEDRLATIEAQLGWMNDAGLRNVDCIWRWRGFALLVGEAP